MLICFIKKGSLIICTKCFNNANEWILTCRTAAGQTPTALTGVPGTYRAWNNSQIMLHTPPAASNPNGRGRTPYKCWAPCVISLLIIDLFDLFIPGPIVIRIVLVVTSLPLDFDGIIIVVWKWSTEEWPIVDWMFMLLIERILSFYSLWQTPWKYPVTGLGSLVFEMIENNERAWACVSFFQHQLSFTYKLTLNPQSFLSIEIT